MAFTFSIIVVNDLVKQSSQRSLSLSLDPHSAEMYVGSEPSYYNAQ